MLRPAEIGEILLQYNCLEGDRLEKAADKLLNKANELGGPDNITFELICYA